MTATNASTSGLSSTELIWILDADKESIDLYQQTLGLQYQLRILKSFDEFVEAAEKNFGASELATAPGEPPVTWLLIVDPQASQGPLREFFRKSTTGAAFRLPECLIVSSVDDLQSMRFYLRNGVRDYLLKPIRPNELVAKVERALQSINNREILILRNDLDGLEIGNLTFKEHQLLTVFLSRVDRSVKRDELYGAIWSKVNVNRKTLDVHLFNLRRKLRPHGYDIVCHAQIFSLLKQVPENP